jgi:hypothetical protein
MTSVENALVVSLTLVMNFSLVLMMPVSDAFTVLECFTGVNGTTEKFLTGVNNTGEAKLPVSRTLAKSMTPISSDLALSV